MSTSYRFSIRRKIDDKIIGIFWGDHIKSIVDSKYDGLINCNGRHSSKTRLEFCDLENVVRTVKNDITANYSAINEKKMMIPMCKSVQLKDAIERDIIGIMEAIDELFDILHSTIILQGEITALVEDNISLNQVMDKNGIEEEINYAYMYNATGLEQHDNDINVVFNNNIYCEIEAC